MSAIQKKDLGLGLLHRWTGEGLLLCKPYLHPPATYLHLPTVRRTYHRLGGWGPGAAVVVVGCVG